MVYPRLGESAQEISYLGLRRNTSRYLIITANRFERASSLSRVRSRRIADTRGQSGYDAQQDT